MLRTVPDPTVSSPGRPRRPRLTLATVCAPMFLVLLDVLVVNVAMPSVGTALAVPTRAWSGLVDAYTIPLAVGLLPGGWATDRLGPRIVLTGGTALFGAASLGCATAATWSWLLLARGVQGVGAAAMLPASLAALTGLWREPATRARALGTWSGLSALATAAGPVVGGVLLAVSSWRAVFWVNLPLCLAAVAGAHTLLPGRLPRLDRGARSRPRPLVGSTLAGALMTTVGNGVLTAATLDLRGPLRLAALPAAGVLLLGTVPFAGLGPVSGRAMTRYGRRAVAVTGLLGGAAGFLAAAVVGRWVPAARVPVMLLAVGVGLGLMTAAIVGEAMHALPGRQGLAGGVNNTARQLGTSAGVALATAALASPAGLGRVLVVATVVWLACAVVVAVSFTHSQPNG